MFKCIWMFTLLLSSLSVSSVRAQMSESQLRDKLMASTVVVVATLTDGKIFMGTGWVLSKSEKKIITSYHVINDAASVAIIFPRRGPTGWITKEQDIIAFPRQHASVTSEATEVDLAILTVSDMPSHISQFKLANQLPTAGDDVYVMGHRAVQRQLFRFMQGKVDGTGFNAVTVTNRKPPFAIRADSVAFEAENVLEGTSGGALVNSTGEVVGVITSSANVNNVATRSCKAISVREIQKILGTKKIADNTPAKSIVGRWVGKVSNSDSEFGLEFTPDLQFTMSLELKFLAGSYSVTRNSVTLTKDGSPQKCQLRWINDDNIKLTFGDLLFDCRRHDDGWLAP